MLHITHPKTIMLRAKNLLSKNHLEVSYNTLHFTAANSYSIVSIIYSDRNPPHSKCILFALLRIIDRSWIVTFFTPVRFKFIITGFHCLEWTITHLTQTAVRLYLHEFSLFRVSRKTLHSRATTVYRIGRYIFRMSSTRSHSSRLQLKKGINFFWSAPNHTSSIFQVSNHSVLSKHVHLDWGAHKLNQVK